MTEQLSPDALTALLLASAHAIAAEASALGPRARVRPAEGSWCANEIIGHLIEAETRGFSGQIRTMLAASEPPLPTWDQPAVAAARNDQAKDTSDLLAELTELRADSLSLVRSLTAADLARGGIHPKVGRLTVQDIAHEWVHHDREHLIALLEISRAFAWDGMGGARRFTEPEV